MKIAPGIVQIQNNQKKTFNICLVLQILLRGEGDS